MSPLVRSFTYTSGTHPHLGFSRPSRITRSLSSGSTGGRPMDRCRPKVHFLLTSSRCHLIVPARGGPRISCWPSKGERRWRSPHGRREFSRELHAEGPLESRKEGAPVSGRGATWGIETGCAHSPRNGACLRWRWYRSRRYRRPASRHTSWISSVRSPAFRCPLEPGVGPARPELPRPWRQAQLPPVAFHLLVGAQSLAAGWAKWVPLTPCVGAPRWGCPCPRVGADRPEGLEVDACDAPGGARCRPFARSRGPFLLPRRPTPTRAPALGAPRWPRAVPSRLTASRRPLRNVYRLREVGAAHQLLDQ
jgi:hypothetical protein